jgi:hypothetical protein
MIWPSGPTTWADDSNGVLPYDLSPEAADDPADAPTRRPALRPVARGGPTTRLTPRPARPALRPVARGPDDPAEDPNGVARNYLSPRGGRGPSWHPDRRRSSRLSPEAADDLLTTGHPRRPTTRVMTRTASRATAVTRGDPLLGSGGRPRPGHCRGAPGLATAPVATYDPGSSPGTRAGSRREPSDGSGAELRPDRRSGARPRRRLDRRPVPCHGWCIDAWLRGAGSAGVVTRDPTGALGQPPGDWPGGQRLRS